MLRFDWDERKNKADRTKHGVWFEEARSVFDDPRALLFPVHCKQRIRRIISHHFGKEGEQEGGENL
jgi:uncharacterized DUF497 family protein